MVSIEQFFIYCLIAERNKLDIGRRRGHGHGHGYEHRHKLLLDQQIGSI